MFDFNEHLLNDLVLAGQKPALVEFWAPWCIYSRLLKPKTDAMSQRFADQLLVGRFNIADHLPFVQSLGIEFVPALGLFQGGRLMEKWYGDLPLREVTDVIAKYSFPVANGRHGM